MSAESSTKASPALTVTTIRYLFATSWLPCDRGQHLVAVPGGSTTAMDTAANLLHTAIWNLRRQGVFELTQLRPVKKERVTVLGGRSFAGFEFRDPETELRGLEGALLRAAREVGPAEGLTDRGIDRISGEDEHGIRRLATAMSLDHKSPWLTVTNCCLSEAAAAGLVRQTGWALKKVAIVDAEAIESLRERNDELRAARSDDMDRDPELHNAVIADCLHAIHWARNPHS